MVRKLTYEEVKHFIEVGSGSGCRLLSEEYLGNKSLLKIQCKCRNEFYTRFNNFKNSNKRQCEECGGRIQWTFDKVKKFIDYDSNSYCTLLSESFVSASDKLVLQCKCGDVFSVRFNDFYSKNQRQCQRCGYENGAKERRFTYAEIKKYIEVKSKSGCKLLSELYMNCEGKILLECSCGSEFETTFVEFKHQNKHLCNHCSKLLQNIKSSKTHEQFCKDVKDVLGEDYTVLSRYKNSSTKVTIKHELCGYEYKANPTDITSSQSGCPKCNRSKGELRVERWLLDNRVKYINEYSFDDCVSEKGNSLRFDFYLPNIHICIEFDGEGHYYPFRFSKDKNKMKNKLQQTQINDNIKNQYCKDKNIPLLRIPYREFDSIEQILEEWLEKHGVLHKNEKIA